MGIYIYRGRNGRLRLLGVNVWFEAEGKFHLVLLLGRVGPMCYKGCLMRGRWNLGKFGFYFIIGGEQ